MKLRLEEDVPSVGAKGDFVDIPDRFAYPMLSAGTAVRVEGCHPGAKVLPMPDDLAERAAQYTAAAAGAQETPERAAADAQAEQHEQSKSARQRK